MTQARHEAGDHPVETLYEGQWLRMKRRGHWEYAERCHGNGMAVIIIAATPDDHVLFVEQYRVPLGKRTIEMPAGLVGDDHAHDTLESAARREQIEKQLARASSDARAAQAQASEATTSANQATQSVESAERALELARQRLQQMLG